MSFKKGVKMRGERLPPTSEERGASKTSEKGSLSQCFQNIQYVCKKFVLGGFHSNYSSREEMEILMAEVTERRKESEDTGKERRKGGRRLVGCKALCTT